MNRLIKNELIKIFHKKSLYIILLIFLIFMITEKVMNIIVEKYAYTYYDEDVSFYQDELEELDKNNPEEREFYISIESNIEEINLVKKYGIDSWQEYIIRNYGYQIIYNVKEAEGTERYDDAKAEYDKFIKRLESNDWKFYAQEELKEINFAISQIESSENKNEPELQNLKDNKQVLEWRLEKDICYANSNLNTYLEQWIANKSFIDVYNEKSKKSVVQYRDKYEAAQAISIEAISRYAIENRIDKQYIAIDGTNIISTESNNELIIWIKYSVFIVIAVAIIAGTSISEEFHKGTIKLLLVRPYKRTKILIAKFITCILILLLVNVVVVFMQYIVTGIFNGFGSFSNQIVTYNFGTNHVEQVNLISFILLTAVAKAPMFILLMTVTFTLSVVFNNSGFAIAFPMLGTIVGGIINDIAFRYEKARFLRFFVTPNWDLTIFMFGKSPQFELISLPFSITICLIYFIAMIGISLLVFKKKDIKNI